MVNPRAKIYLEWSTLKDVDLGRTMENVQKKGVTVVSGKDMVIPEETSRYFGLIIWKTASRTISPCLCGTGVNFMSS